MTIRTGRHYVFVVMCFSVTRQGTLTSLTRSSVMNVASVATLALKGCSSTRKEPRVLTNIEDVVRLFSVPVLA